MNSNEQCSKQFINELSKNEFKRGGYSKEVSTARHSTKTKGSNTPTVHFLLPGPNKNESRRFNSLKLLPNIIVKAAQTDWASPIDFWSETGGTSWLNVDYHKLQVLRNRDLQPLSRINECNCMLRKATVVSIPDANSTYWQIDIKNLIVTILYEYTLTDCTALYACNSNWEMHQALCRDWWTLYCV